MIYIKRRPELLPQKWPTPSTGFDQEGGTAFSVASAFGLIGVARSSECLKETRSFLVSLPHPDYQRLPRLPCRLGHAEPVAITAQDIISRYRLRWSLLHFDYAEIHAQAVVAERDIFPHTSWSWKGARMQEQHNIGHFDPNIKFLMLIKTLV